MRRRSVVFDLGGVVLRWQPAELLRQCLADRVADEAAGAALAALFFESFRPGGAWAEFDRGSLDAGTVARRIADGASGLSRSEVDEVIAAIPAHLQLHADCAALIGRLHAAGHRLLYLSNMPAPYVGHVKRQLDGLGAFDDGIFSSDVGIVKPEAEIFHLAMRRFGCAAGELVFLDDSAVNVEAAVRIGWQALHFTGVDDARTQLQRCGLLAPEAGEAGAT